MADQTNFEDSGNITEEALNMTSPVNTDDVQPSPDIDQPLSPSSMVDPEMDLSNLQPSRLTKIEGPGTDVVNFDNAYPDMGSYDPILFDDAVNDAIQTQGMPNLEINQPFRDMIDAAAVDLNKYPALFSNNDLDSLFPGRSGTDYDPFRQSSGIPDLSTSNGIKAYLSHAVEFTKATKPNMTPGYKDPFYYSARRYNLDRYYRHPRFADLGFHPFADNETYYQANSSKWDNFTRTRGQWSATFGPAFTSGWRSIGDMFSGDITQADMLGAQTMDDAMRIGRSGSGGTRGFFNDLFLNSSYTMGIISSIALEEAVLAAATYFSGGAASGVAAARTGANAIRLGKLFTTLKGMSTGGAKMLQKLKSFDNAKAFWQAAKTGGRALGMGMARFFGPETLYQLKAIRTSAKAGDNLTQMAKASRLAGGFYRDLRAVNLAWAESKMEGGLVEMEMREELYKEVMNMKDGEDPSVEEMEMIVSDARAAAFTTQLTNLPIIFLSNKLVLDGALRGFRPLGQLMDQSLSRVYKSAAKGAKNPFKEFGREWIIGENMRRMWKAGFKGSFKHMGATALKYSTANLAEGVQELSQEATANGVKAYYKSLYDSPMGIDLDVKLADMTEDYQNARKSWIGDYDYTDRPTAMSVMDAVKRGVGSQMSGQGLHTFMSGFLMGGLVQGPQKFLMQTTPNLFRWGKDKVMGTTEFADYRAKRDEQVANTVERLNKIYNDPSQYFDIKKLNAMTQKELNSAMFEAAGANDITSFMDFNDHSIFSHLYTVMASGQLHHFKDQMKDFQKLDDVALKEAFSSVSSTPQKIRGRIDRMLNRMDEIETNYNKLKDEYVNPFDPKRYKKGTRKYHEEEIKSFAFENAKMMMMFTKDTFEQSLIRANDIYDSLSSDPVLKSISATDIAALTTREGLIKELALLKKELALEAKTPEEKELQKKKKKKLELLQNYYDVIMAPENQAYTNGQMYYDQREQDGVVYRTKSRNIGRFDKRKIKKLKPAFVAYLQFLAETNDDFVVNEKLDETLKKIVDWNYLKGRATDYHKAMSVLMDPSNLNEVTERLSDIMKSVWESHRDKNNLLLRVKKYYAHKERMEFIKALAEKGIQPDPVQTKKFFEDGTMPTEYFDDQGKITKESDPTSWTIIEGFQQNLREAQRVDKAEKTDETSEERQESEQTKNEEASDENQEPDFDSIVGRSKYQQFYMQDKGTQEIIDNAYLEYKKGWSSEQGPLLDKNKWVASDKGGKNIIKSRYELNEMYQAESAEVKEKNPTLDDWIIANQRNPLVIGTNGILTKNGVSISDVSTILSKDKGLKKDKLQSNEKVINTDKATGITVIETTIYDEDTNKPSVYYSIVDTSTPGTSAVNVVDKYKNLDPNNKFIKRTYAKKADALAALKYLLNNMPQDGTFEFAGQTFSTTDIIVDSGGKEWMVRSNPRMIRNNNNLYIVPIDKAKSKKGEDDRRYLTEQEFKNEKWKKKGDEQVDLTSSLTTKLTAYEPIKIYPFDGGKVLPGYTLHNMYPTPEDVDQQFQDNLKNLTPEQRNNLTLLVERNPNYDKFKKDLESGNLKFKPANENYSVNELIKQGQNEFEVTIMSGNKPIGKLMGLGVSILFDTDGSVIVGSQITTEQAKRLFIIPKGQDANEIAARIRRNYAKAELITKELSDKLEGSQASKIKISELKNIELNVTRGYTGYRIDSKGNPTLKGKNASTPWADLDENSNTYEGEILIYDTRRSRTTGRRASSRMWTIDPGSKKGRKIDNEILNALQARGLNSVGDLNMGRYVQVIKLPNGDIHFFELKVDRFPNEAIADIAQDIKNKQQEILKHNLKDGKYIDKPASKAFVERINQELNESFYILSDVVGDDVSIFFNEFGQLIFKVEREQMLLAEGITRTIALDAAIMEGVVSAETFVETLNANWKANEKDEKALHKKTGKGEFVEMPITVKTDSFTPNLPKNISDPMDLINAGVSARVIPDIVWGQIADLNYTNDVNIANQLSGFKIDQTQEDSSEEFYDKEIERQNENPRYKDDQIPVGTEEFTYTFEDGVTTIKYKAKTYLDGSVIFEQWNEKAEMWGPASKKLNIKADENITALEALDNLNPKDTVTSDKVNDYKTVMNPKMWDRLSPDQQNRIDPDRTGAETPVTNEIFQDLMQKEFENIPDGIINAIRKKLITGDKLSTQEQMIVKAWEESHGQSLVSDNEISSEDAATQKDEEGNQAESDNPDIITKIEDKKKEIAAKKRQLENEYRAQIKEANPTISKGKLNLQVEDMLDVSEELSKLNSELTKLESQLGYKVVDNFDSRDVEDINIFLEWAQRNLPDFINIQDVDGLARRLKANGITLGAFVMSLKNVSDGIESLRGHIYTGRQTSYRYHEAFHGVFRMLLTEQEIKKYLSLAKTDVLKQMRSAKGYEILPGTFVKTMEQARSILKGLSKSYAVLNDKDLNDRVFEEYLADEFEKFKTNPRSSRASSEVKSLFTRILEWIKSIFIAPNNLEYNALFTSIDSGKFKNAAIQENRFTLSAMEGLTGLAELDNEVKTGIPSNLALKAIKKGKPIASPRPVIKDGKIIPDGRIVYINNYFNQEETNGIVAQIGANYMQKVDEISQQKDFDGQYNPKQILEETVNEYNHQYNPKRSTINAQGEEEFFYADRDNWSDFKDRLKERHESLVKYKDDVINSVNEYLTLFDMDATQELEILEKTDMSPDGSVKTTEEYESAANEIGGFKSLSKSVRKFLATQTKQVKDEFTGELVSVPVDYITAYNALMKSLAGITNPQIMLVKLKLFAQSSPDASAVINAIFDRINMSNVTLEELIEGEFKFKQITNASFFQGILKAFSQFRTDYLYIETDTTKGLVNIFKANHRDDASTQTDKWQENYTTKLEKLNNDPKAVSAAQTPWGSIQFLAGKKRISEKQLDSKSREIADEIFNTIGIKLSYLTVKFMILNNGITNKTKAQSQFVKTFSGELLEFNLDDVNEIEVAISNHGLTKSGLQKGNLFYDMSDESIENNEEEVNAEGTDVKSKIKKLAQLNAIFDDTVGATVFRNPEGKLIYAHQMPTYNLEKVAELNSEHALDDLMSEDAFLSSNYLLDDPRFRQLAIDGKLRVSRVSGQKLVELEEHEQGFKSSNGIDLDKKAISFGDSTPKDFLSQMMNLYLSSYNNMNGKVEETKYETFDDNGTKITNKFTTSLTNITVISESNTADFVPLPIIFSVELNDGKSELTDEYVNKIENEIENEYNRIDREVNEKEGYTEDEIKGYNDFNPNNINDKNNKKDRAAKFNKTKELLKSKSQKTEALRKVGEEIKITAGPQEIEGLNQDGGAKILLREGKVITKLGLNQGETVLTPVYTLKNKIPSEVMYAITYRGVQSAESYSIDQIKELLGNDISDIKSAKNNQQVSLGAETYYVRTAKQRDWLKGTTSYGVMEIVPQSELEIEKTTIGDVEVVTDNSIIEALQNLAREGELTYSEAKKKIKEDTGVDITELVKTRLMQEFDEFNTIIGTGGTQAINQVDSRLLNQLKTSEGKTNRNTKKSMDLLNLKVNNPDNHNLKQIFFNDYLNRMSIKQILLGDASMSFKDAVDEIKRMKAVNAAGPNASSVVASPYRYDENDNIIGGHGVNHATKHISLVTLTDIETPPKYGGKGKEGAPVTETDAQMWITPKAFRYMMFGFGSLTTAQSRILDRIEAGEDISIDEFYGSGLTKQGYKELDAIINSKKLVYADGKTFLKMSAFVLTKALSSDPATEFATALPGREAMHNLRIKLEKIEQDGEETIAIAAPESASKMIKKNIISNERAFDSNPELRPEDITDLDARWMRLQQINPSNKQIIIDPTQIKQLITSEQDDSVEVMFAGKMTSIGKIRQIYNDAISNRVEIKYLNRRNLIFDFQKGQDELQESIRLGEVTPDLQAFLMYAQESLAASGSSPQFMELFETDSTGAPKFDLNNPITINKFQELFMSFFTKSVLSEKVNGESVALVSGVGMKVIKKVIELDPVTEQPSRWEVIRMDDYKNLKNRPEIDFLDWSDKENKTFNGIKVNDLYVDELKANVKEYDENGNETGLVYSEFMMPAYHQDLKNVKTGEMIPDVVSKGFGTRIPSQDKHSSVNLKLVDFMPVFYGSSGVFPPDLIEISGADFDIDKLYIQFKEFYRKDGEFVEYGKTENDNEQYQEYLEYTIKESRKKGTTLNMATKVWNSRGNIVDPVLERKEELPSAAIIGALRILNMPVTFDEFIQYKRKHNRVPYTAAQSNIALDAKYALQGNEGMTKGRNGRKVGLAYEPANLDPLEEVWNFIAGLKDEDGNVIIEAALPELAEQVKEEGVMVDNMVGMYRAWKNNKEGARSIGAIVLPNIIFNMLKENKINLRQTNNKGFPILGGNIELNGVKYKSFKGDYTIDPNTGKPDKTNPYTRKQNIISALVTAATDNAKERLLAKLGLNKDALAVVGNLVSIGVDIQTSILLVNQPDIKFMYSLAANKDKPTDPGINGLLKSELVAIEETDSLAAANAKKINVTTDLLMKHIRGEELKTHERYAILKQFQQARELKTYTGHIQALATKVAGLDRGMKEMYDSFESFDKLGIELNQAQFSKDFKIPFDARILFKGNNFQSTYYKIFKNIQQLTPSIFITETNEFRKLQMSIVSNMDSSARTPERIEKVKKDILSYIIGKAYTKYLEETGRAQLIESLQNGMIYDEFAGEGLTINKVIGNIQDYLRGEKQSNYFIDNFIFKKDTKNPNNKSGINQAVMNTWSKLSPTQVTNLQNSLRDLYAIPTIRKDVVHLIHYLLVKDGLQYSQGSFLSIIPAPLLDEILMVTKGVNDLFNSESISKQQYKNLFGIDFNEMVNEITEGYMQSRNNVYFAKEIKVTKFGVQKYLSKKKDMDDVQEETEEITETEEEVLGRKKTANKPIIYDQDSGTLEIRLFKQRGRKKKTKKGKHREIPKGSTFEKTLQTTGIELIDEKINDKTVKVMVTPVVVKMNIGTRKKPDYRMFMLEEVYSSKKIEKTDISDPNYTPQMINFDQEFGLVTGHRVVYREFKPFGSMQQNGMGFMWGDRSTYEYLQEQLEKKDAAVNDGKEASIIDKIAGQDQKPPKKVGPGTNTSVEATNDSVKFTETTTDTETKPVYLSKLEKMSKEGTVFTGKGVDINTFKKNMAMDENTKTPTENKELTEFYENLSKVQKAMIARTIKEGGLDISTPEELIEEFNHPNNMDSVEEMKERLKKCYTN
tara:strand:- start:702 stop:16298 length:15597 start_codon:yes stop_codon:yes gene_type:complete